MRLRDDFFRNISLKPFKFLRPSVRTEAYFILAALLAHVVMLFATKSFSALGVVFAGTLASCAVEGIQSWRGEKSAFNWTIAIIQGILIGFLIPEQYPPVTVFFIALCVLLVNTFILGGFANSWANPVCITVAICWILGMKFFPSVGISFADLQAKNPALSFIQNGTFPMASFDPKVTGFLNSKVFSIFGVSIPDGYVSLFWDSHSPIPAFRFNFLTILSSLVLFSFDTYGLLVPSFFIFAYGVLVKFIAPFFYGGILFSGDVLLALLTSGILFSNLFLIQWYGTIPLTNRGKIFYGAFAGFLAFWIVGCGLSPVGAVFTILIVNLVSLLIQSIENHYQKQFEATVLAPRIKAVEEGIDA